MHRPEEATPLDDFRLHIRYADDVEGEVDLSYLAGRGVFEIWNEEGAFEQVSIGPGGAIAWADGLEICSDALYMQLTGNDPEDLFPNLTPYAAGP